MDTVIQVQDVNKRYGGIDAVKGISFAVSQGEIFGLLGPNGAGKTTTIEIVMGLRQPDSGSVEVLGQNVRNAGRSLREQIGVQLQSTAIYPRMKVREALEFFGGFYKHRLSVDQVLKLVGLMDQAEKGFRTLSGGQKQRLALGLALIHDPQVVFLDETTAGMDPQGRRSVWNILDQLRRDSKSILLTTHYMEEAERICDRVGIIDQGILVALGTPREIISAAGLVDRVTFESDRQDVVAAIQEIAGVTRVINEYGHFTVFANNGQIIIPRFQEAMAMCGADLRNVSVAPANLEDAFLVLTGRRLA